VDLKTDCCKDKEVVGFEPEAATISSNEKFSGDQSAVSFVRTNGGETIHICCFQSSIVFDLSDQVSFADSGETINAV
jgi:hypothetical protein